MLAKLEKIEFGTQLCAMGAHWCTLDLVKCFSVPNEVVDVFGNFSHVFGCVMKCFEAWFWFENI